MAHKYIVQSVNLNGQSFADFYDELSRGWEEKAARLQARRRQKIKHSARDSKQERLFAHAKPNLKHFQGRIL